ncbi:MAG TPA: cytosine deaminase [Xanthobacteraceae bacterium]|nr:cytosine deaminase [Xanthobacteraceae bacterium]
MSLRRMDVRVKPGMRMMNDVIRQIPERQPYRIVNARVPIDLAPTIVEPVGPDRLVACEIVVDGSRIAMLAEPGGAPAGDLATVDMQDGIVLPRFVDAHTHLDKGHIWARSPNPDGSFFGARSAVAADREARWTPDDVRKRMDFALRCAFAHGTGAIRTHLDSIGKQTAITWPVFAEMRETWKDRITLQAVALFPVDMTLDAQPEFRARVETVARYGGILGGLTFLGDAPGPKLEAALDRLFQAAIANGLDLDFHVDESCAPEARTLERIAVAAVRNRFEGRIIAGHCCSLALASEADRTRIIERLAEARMCVVSLPLCNMYLQDRTPGRTPRLRGVAPVHELNAAGVPVMVASDNTRDPFYAYGDLDMLEVFREATRILHLDHSEQPWMRLLGVAPADILGFADRGQIAVGAQADLVLTRARTLNELLSRPQTDRAVIVAGRAIDTTLPDYRELDELR